MTKKHWLLKSLVLFALLVVPLSLAHAQADRTWISGVGDDAQPCSRVAPCKTFAGAISKTGPGGEIDVMDAGGFGAVTIPKAITIDGGGYMASARVGGVNGITITAGKDDVVVLRHLSLSGSSVSPGTNGIKVNQAKTVYVIDCLIRNFTQKGIDFEPGSEATLVVRDSFIMNNGTNSTGAGIFVKGSADLIFAYASIDNTRADGNSVGIAANENSKVSISNSVISRSGVVGLLAAAFSGSLSTHESPFSVEMNVERSTVTLNTIGIQSGNCPGLGNAVVRISNVNVTSNTADGLKAIAGGGRPICGAGSIISSKNNTVLGNRPDGAPTSVSPQN